MDRQKGWARFGMAMAVLLALAILAHLAGGNLMHWFGKLHGH